MSADRLRETLRDLRYQSLSGRGERGFMEHHIDAIVEALRADGMEDACPNCGLERWPKDPLSTEEADDPDGGAG